MRITTTIAAAVAALIPLAAAAPARAQHGASPDAIRPAAHEELGGLIDDMAGQIHSLGDRLRGHLGVPAARERPLISIMLEHRDELELTTAQVQALEGLRSEFQKEAIRREADIRIAETDIAALLKADLVDLSKVEARVREAERQRAELRLARIRVIEQAKGQLSAEQRSRLARLAADPWRPAARPHPMVPPPLVAPPPHVSPKRL